MKAFGVCGDTETAFVLADEAPPEEKYNSAMLSALLMTCCSDKIAGYQLAIAVRALYLPLPAQNDLTLFRHAD